MKKSGTHVPDPFIGLQRNIYLENIQVGARSSAQEPIETKAPLKKVIDLIYPYNPTFYYTPLKNFASFFSHKKYSTAHLFISVKSLFGVDYIVLSKFVVKDLFLCEPMSDLVVCFLRRA